MKLILEGCALLNGEIEDELNEASGATERNYYISGIFSTPEAKNRNGRTYSRSIWEREVEKYQEEISSKSVNTLGEWQHPARSTVDPIKAVLRIVELKLNEDGNVWGRAKILNDNTETTNKLKGLIKEGIKIGVSSRGVGKVSSSGVVEDFKLITYDAVDLPSDYNAMLNGVVEGVQFINGIAQDKEYIIDENGCIGEACNIALTTESTESETTEKCPIKQKIEETVDAAKKEIYENLDRYLKIHSDEIQENTSKLIENIDLYLKEAGVTKDEPIIEEPIDKEQKITTDKALALIEALKLMAENNKLDAELKELVKMKKITPSELEYALKYSSILTDNDADIKEWEKDMGETFPKMDQAVFSILRDKFLGK